MHVYIETTMQREIDRKHTNIDTGRRGYKNIQKDENVNLSVVEFALVTVIVKPGNGLTLIDWAHIHYTHTQAEGCIERWTNRERNNSTE